MYEVTARRRIFVRSSPSACNFFLVKNRYFEPGELVSVDLIRHSREDCTNDNMNNNNNNSNNRTNNRQRRGDGPFLRLSDGSGWIVARKGEQEEYVMRMPVEETTAPNEVWEFYADNIPFGIELRRHPIEELNNPEDTNRFSPSSDGITYQPMQKIVCDRKIAKDDSTFFRVQGTCGWVFDKYDGGNGNNNNNNNNNNNEDDQYREMMIEGNLVETGLFAFRVTSKDGIGIRKSCHVSDRTDNMANIHVKCGEIIVADIVRQSPLHNGNGPFVRLTDGSGWLFQHKNGSDPLMEEISITKGIFQLRIRSSTGIKLRDQPIDPYYYQDYTRGPVLKQNETIICDRKLFSPSGVTFFRQQGTDLWIFDKRDGDNEIVAEIISESESSSLLGNNTRDNNNNNNNFDNSLKYPWSPQFIRGNANVICGLQEIDFDPQRKLLSYRSSDDVSINVYYGSRMIGTVLDNSRTNGRVQHFHRNCSDAELIAIFQHPRAYRGGDRQCNKRARLLRPSPITTTLLVDEDGDWDDDFDFAVERESRREPLTPDASFSSGVEDEHTIDDGDDDFDAEQESRRNLVDCQKEIKNLRYREGNILRAIRMHEVERTCDAKIMKTRTEQMTIYQRQNEEEERLQQQLLEEEERLRLIEEERIFIRERRRYRLVFENVCVGSIVGCFIGLSLSPLFGPLLVQKLGI